MTVENEKKEEEEDDITSGKAARRAARLQTMSEKRMLQPWTCACCSDVNPAPQQARSLLRQQSLQGRDGDEPLVSCRMCGKILSSIDAGTF